MQMYRDSFSKMYVNISTIEKIFWLFIYKLCFLFKKTMENTDNIIKKNEYVKILYFL